MKKTLLLFTAFLFCGTLFAQKQYSDEELKVITDSILKEGEFLYKLEKSSWWATDFVRKDNKLENSNGGYLSYVSNDTIKCVIFNKKKNKVLLEAGFIDAFNKPEYANTEVRDITAFEKKLVEIRKHIADSLIKPEYELEFFSKHPYNSILIPDGKNYRFYLISGTNVKNVIPFGNDYLFNCDSDGNIISFRKFHPKLIVASLRGPNGEFNDTISHNHTANEPFITSTDICNFLLYGKLYNISTLSIYSPSLNLTFKYYWKPNTISIVK